MAKSKKAAIPLDNVLIPEHKVMSEEEVSKLLVSLGISRDKLPKILSSDPALQGQSPKDGDIVRIKRKDLVGDYDYYRVVVSSPR